MGSGSRAYSEALGQYMALQEHLGVTGGLELEQLRAKTELELELAQQQYKLMQEGKLPGLVDSLETTTQAQIAAVPETPSERVTDAAEPTSDPKKLIILAVIFYFVFLRK